MRLYLDDDSAERLLVQLLSKAGHDVQKPSDVSRVGAADPIHLAHAIREDRVLLSRNYRDFADLHELIVAAAGTHPGILIVRKDNDPRRDLQSAGIVRTIQKLEVAGLPVRDQLHVLNHWR